MVSVFFFEFSLLIVYYPIYHDVGYGMVSSVGIYS
jgi:hypothetical protein